MAVKAEEKAGAQGPDGSGCGRLDQSPDELPNKLALDPKGRGGNDSAPNKNALRPWWVCHCKPRCEKKFSALMQAHGFEHYLPLVTSERRYGTRIKSFTKPLFPGYVFAEVPPEQKPLIYQQDLLARALEVENVPRLLAQLDDIRALLASGLDFTLKPLLMKGRRVRIISGPLKGVEGFVESPESNGKHGSSSGGKTSGVLLSIDVLQQGILVPVPAADLKVLP